MNDQLVLLDDDDPARAEGWRLDEQTRELGRRGVALAREALRSSKSCSSKSGQAAARAA